MYGDFGPPQGAPPMPPEAFASMAGDGQEAPAPEGGGPISDLLRQMLSLARQYKDQEQSEQNILLIEQVTTQVQKILANEEKEADDLLQGKMSPSAVRSAVSGPSY